MSTNSQNLPDLPPAITAIIQRRFGDRPAVIPPLMAVAREIVDAIGSAPPTPAAGDTPAEAIAMLRKCAAAFGVLLKAPAIAGGQAEAGIRSIKREVDALVSQLRKAPSGAVTVTQADASTPEPAASGGVQITEQQAEALAHLLSAVTARKIVVDAPIGEGSVPDISAAQQRFAQAFGLSANA